MFGVWIGLDWLFYFVVNDNIDYCGFLLCFSLTFVCGLARYVVVLFCRWGFASEFRGCWVC